MTSHAIVHGTAVTDPLVSVRNLRVSFRLDRHNTFDAVRGISFDIPRNTTVALVGESGSGKKRHLARDPGTPAAGERDHPQGSEIRFGARNLAALSTRELRDIRAPRSR